MESKKELQKIINKSKKFSKKLNKIIKNKSTLKKCNDFCKKYYIPKMNNILKKSAKKYNHSYQSPTKEENKFAYNTCKKTFCNKNCDGYDFFGDKQQQLNFKKNIKMGFKNHIRKRK